MKRDCLVESLFASEEQIPSIWRKWDKYDFNLWSCFFGLSRLCTFC